jgi:SAM-dependent methyltransferase
MSVREAPRVDPSNRDQAIAWDGAEGSYWAARSDRFDRSLAEFNERFLDAAAIDDGAKVLDIGCGTGWTTRAAARRAASGSALGVDLSERMIAEARAAAGRDGPENARFLQADAQVYPFTESSFDVAISRTGAMFFGGPDAAFANIARALRPGGRLVLLTWREAALNEWIGEFAFALAAGRDLPHPPPDAPGPFSLADPERVRSLLEPAGFTRLQFEALDERMYFGSDPDDGFGFVSGLLGWMLNGLDADGRTRALDALRASIEAHATDRGVAYRAAAWLITAERSR